MTVPAGASAEEVDERATGRSVSWPATAGGMTSEADETSEGETSCVWDRAGDPALDEDDGEVGSV